MKFGMNTIDDFDLNGKNVLLRLDMNSPIDPETKKILNEDFIKLNVPTIKTLLERRARLVIISHQGDLKNYGALISMDEHARILSKEIGQKIEYVDDVAGPEARSSIKRLTPGRAILLGNLKYLSEETVAFEKNAKLTAEDLGNTYLIRNLIPFIDIYVNDAFSLAHRSFPSIIGFEKILPSAGGPRLVKEMKLLTELIEEPARPAVYIVGGLKVFETMGLLEHLLKKNCSDKILLCSVINMIFQIAEGRKIGVEYEKSIDDNSLTEFVKPARSLMDKYMNNFINSVDFAYEKNGARIEVPVNSLPIDNAIFSDIGERTANLFEKEISSAETIFIKGTPGAYENNLFETGTKKLLDIIAESDGYSILCGEGICAAAHKFFPDIEEKFGYLFPASEPVIKFITGVDLPLLLALKEAYKRYGTANI